MSGTDFHGVGSPEPFSPTSPGVQPHVCGPACTVCGDSLKFKGRQLSASLDSGSGRPAGDQGGDHPSPLATAAPSPVLKGMERPKGALPVWLCDIDGVLAQLPFHAFGGVKQREKSVPVAKLPARVEPGIIARINGFHDAGLMELLWSTSWREDAKAQFAPAAGLRDFEVATTAERMGKLSAAERVPEDRPMLWTDDAALEEEACGDWRCFNGYAMAGYSMSREGNDLLRRRTGPTLVIGCMHGALEHDDLDLIERFLRAPYDYTGPRAVGFPAKLALRLHELALLEKPKDAANGSAPSSTVEPVTVRTSRPSAFEGRLASTPSSAAASAPQSPGPSEVGGSPVTPSCLADPDSPWLRSPREICKLLMLEFPEREGMLGIRRVTRHVEWARDGWPSKLRGAAPCPCEQRCRKSGEGACCSLQ